VQDAAPDLVMREIDAMSASLAHGTAAAAK
jgi:hypothetical protein